MSGARSDREVRLAQSDSDGPRPNELEPHVESSAKELQIVAQILPGRAHLSMLVDDKRFESRPARERVQHPQRAAWVSVGARHALTPSLTTCFRASTGPSSSAGDEPATGIPKPTGSSS